MRKNETTRPDAKGVLRLTSKEKASVREALDTLALALTDHGHVWTDRERSAYERAVRILG
jgi:hypothetical protein